MSPKEKVVEHIMKPCGLGLTQTRFFTGYFDILLVDMAFEKLYLFLKILLNLIVQKMNDYIWGWVGRARATRAGGKKRCRINKYNIAIQGVCFSHKVHGSFKALFECHFLQEAWSSICGPALPQKIPVDWESFGLCSTCTYMYIHEIACFPRSGL